MFRPYLSYSATGIPILSRDQIDQITERYLKEYSPDVLARPQKVDVEKLAQEYMKFGTDFKCLSSDKRTLGMFVFEASDWIAVYDEETKSARYVPERENTIVIDNQLLEAGQEGRYRFTFAHELGHGVLHRMVMRRPKADPYQEYLSLFNEDYASPADGKTAGANEEALGENKGTASGAVHMFRCSFFNRAIDTKPESQWRDEDWLEWQADAFSSSILMPAGMVRAVAKETDLSIERSNDFQWNSFDGISRQITRAERVGNEISRVFGVSRSAAFVRMKQLGIADIQKLCSQAFSSEMETEGRRRRNDEWGKMEDAHYKAMQEEYEQGIKHIRRRRRKRTAAGDRSS